MIAQLINRAAYITVLGLYTTAWSVQAADDPLSSWNDGRPSRRSSRSSKR
jgi:hypothetical protein